MQVINYHQSTIGAINHIRYKSYYYDDETHYYYLETRYYNPEIGRFIQPDEADYLNPSSINEINLYSYCGNDPINRLDSTGHFSILVLIGLVAASMIVASGFQIYSNYKAGAEGKELFDGVLSSSLGAGVNTLILFTMPYLGGMELIFAAAGSAFVQTITDATIDSIKGIEKEPNDYFRSFIKTTGLNFAGNLFGAKLIKTNPGWFKPQHFISTFTKSYGTKILMQSYIGSGLSAIDNLIKKIQHGDYS